MKTLRLPDPTFSARDLVPGSIIDLPADRPGRWLTVILLVAALGALAAIPALAQPFAATQAAGPITDTDATLNGMATPNGATTVAWFEWGANTNYGNTTHPVDVGEGLSVVRVSATVAGLDPSAIYHCRLVSSNAMGQVVGADLPLTTGRRLSAWGANVSGLTNDARRFGRVTTIGSGARHALAVIADGAVVAWGDNASSKATVPASLTHAVAVAGGENHSVALRADGTVLAWGNNMNRQTNVPAGLRDVVAIACGGSHSLALKADGTVVAWGWNNAGQTNVPAGLSNVVGLAAGRMHSLALKADGTVVGWGNNGAGQTTAPPGLNRAVALAAGDLFSLALCADGTVLGWGTNSSGQLTVPADLTNAVAIAAGAAYGLALKADGTVAAWGANSAGQTDVPVGLSNVVAIAAGASHGLALGRVPAQPFAHTQPAGPVTATSATLNGMVTPNSLPTMAWFEWGSDASYGRTTTAVDVGAGVNVVHVTAPVISLEGRPVYHYRVVASNELGVICGADTILATGLKAAVWDESARANKRLPAGARDVVAVEASHLHSLALKPDGTVLAWGEPGGWDFGQTTVPAGLSEVIALAGGWQHSLALKADGTVVGWGAYGWVNLPVFVPADLREVVAIATGDSHSLALKRDGAVVAWGYDHQLATQLTLVPRGLANVVAIAAGADRSVALRDDGTILTWGKSGRTNPTKPMPSSLSNVVAIACTSYHVVVQLADGTVGAWGEDYWGQSTVPAGLTNVLAVAAGQSRSLALKPDGSIVIWGSLSEEQTNAMAAFRDVAAISAGDIHCMALSANAPPLPSSTTATGVMNQDNELLPPCYDPDGDPLTFRVVSLPAVGALFQYTAEGRGAPITAPNALVSDPLGRVIFVPASDEIGLPYASFSMTAQDGQYESAPGVVTLNILPPIEFPADALTKNTDGSVTLSFDGMAAASYSVYASTNLVNWTWLGSASQPTPEQFLFNDSTSTNYLRRFYRIRAP